MVLFGRNSFRHPPSPHAKGLMFCKGPTGRNSPYFRLQLRQSCSHPAGHQCSGVFMVLGHGGRKLRTLRWEWAQGERQTPASPWPRWGTRQLPGIGLQTTYLHTWTGSPPFTCLSELSPHIGETSQKMQTRSCHFLTEDPQWCPTVLKLNSRPWHLRLLTLPPCPLSVPVLWPH